MVKSWSRVPRPTTRSDAAAAALAALGVAGYTERDALMQHWPASKRVYGTLGLAPMGGTAGEAKAPDAKAADAKAGDAKRAAGH